MQFNSPGRSNPILSCLQGGEVRLTRGEMVLITSSGLTHGLVLAKTVVVGDWRLQPPPGSLLAGVRVPAQPHLLLLLLAVVLHVLPQAARVSVLLLAAEDLTLVRFLQR